MKNKTATPKVAPKRKPSTHLAISAFIDDGVGMWMSRISDVIIVGKLDSAMVMRAVRKVLREVRANSKSPKRLA